MKHIFFYATRADIMPVLQRFEANADLKYVEMGKRATANREIYLTYKEIPSLGIASQATGSASQAFMVSIRNIKNRMYTFKTRQGLQRWMLSNGDNQHAAVLTPAGIWRTGTLLPGTMTTMHETTKAQELMRWYLAALKKENFEMSDVWWLGPEARNMLKSGCRLAPAEQSPPQLDLKPSALHA